jgi:hypothetical protein
MLLGPPLLLAPFLAAFARATLVRRRAFASLPRLRSLGVAWLELLLWLVLLELERPG